MMKFKKIFKNKKTNSLFFAKRVKARVGAKNKVFGISYK
jgi:hypothetical protein